MACNANAATIIQVTDFRREARWQRRLRSRHSRRARSCRAPRCSTGSCAIRAGQVSLCGRRAVVPINGRTPRASWWKNSPTSPSKARTPRWWAASSPPFFIFTRRRRSPYDMLDHHLGAAAAFLGARGARTAGSARLRHAAGNPAPSRGRAHCAGWCWRITPSAAGWRTTAGKSTRRKESAMPTREVCRTDACAFRCDAMRRCRRSAGKSSPVIKSMATTRSTSWSVAI